jgi:hypothetical protein
MLASHLPGALHAFWQVVLLRLFVSDFFEQAEKREHVFFACFSMSYGE